jgi:hypothetical protein
VEEVYPAACDGLDIGVFVDEMSLPPGPPGFSRIVRFPLSEAFVASILMRGMENVLSVALWR